MAVNKLQSVVFHAVQTFKNSSVEEVKLNKLIALVNEVKFTDLSIPSRLISKTNDTTRSIDPVAHLSCFEDQNVVIGIFILKQGAKIPLHDHPGMHGLLKVLHGAIQVTSYSLVDPPNSLVGKNNIRTVKNPSIILSEKDGCSRLTPVINNIHEVVCVSGPAAFLDILSPPYDDDYPDTTERSCHYFSEAKEGDNGEMYLKQIPCPGNYWFEQDL